jgi:transposase-like protein
MDAIHYKVRTDGQIVNRATYVVMGVDITGKKIFWEYGLEIMNLQSSG